MNRNLLFVILTFLILSLACRSSSRLTPLPVDESDSTITPELPPSATQSSESTSDTDITLQQLLQDIMASARDVQRDVTYCTVDGVELKMNIYFPKNKTGVTPLAVYIHGGGWSRGDKISRVGMTDVPALLDAGFTVASLNYRLAPTYKFPAMLEDVKCAIRSFRANANQYKIDPNKIGLWCESAGAHLCSMIGLTDENAGFDVGEYLDQSSRVQVVIDMSGPTDLTDDFSPTFVDLKDDVYPGYDMVKASPVTYITSDDPPFLILQGTEDIVLPIGSGQAQKLYDGLIAAGVEAQMVIVENGPHLLDAPDQSPSRAELTQMIVQFFVDHLK